MSTINEKQKAAVDELFVNGFNRKKAYASAYPNCDPARRRDGMQRILALPHVQEYYQAKYDIIKEMSQINVFHIIESLRIQIEHYEDLVDLVTKDKLTTAEEQKLERMERVIKGADAMRARDMICKLIGAYEPQKIIVEEKVYKVGFDLGADDAEIVE